MGETCDTWRGKDMLLLLVCSIAGVEGLATVGNLPTLHHDVAGTVLAVTNTNLLIKDFIYDGTAPDAFFWVGTEGAPGSVVEGPDGATWNHTAILRAALPLYRYRLPCPDQSSGGGYPSDPPPLDAGVRHQVDLCVVQGFCH